jgi:phospholipase/lecithinase/hemolysin
MNSNTLHRFVALAVLVASGLLASCGSSSIKDPFVPTRVVVFGDSFSVVSTTAAYTVNDATTNNWAKQIADTYGVTSVDKHAVGNATVADVAAQVAAFGSAYQAGDLVIVSAGYRDIIDDATAGTSTAAAKGTAFANVIRSIVANGAKHVAVANAYRLDGTPAAIILPALAGTVALSNGQSGTRVRAFNDALKSNLGSPILSYIGGNVRLLDTEYYMNLVLGAPNGYSFADATTVACNSPGTGIGVGTIDSSACTPATLNPLANATTYNADLYDNYVFADNVYPTPAFHRAFGAYVYAQLVARW